MGVKAPGGCTVDELWQSLCKSLSTAREFDDPRLPPDVRILVSLVDDFDPAAYLTPAEVRRFDRSHQLAVGAAQDAMDAVQGPLPPPERCAVVCGVGLGASATYDEQHANLLERGVRAMSPLTTPMVMPSATASLLSLRLGFRGPCLTVATACASGATAIGEGVELLRRGAADLVLAGGVDSLVTYGALCSFSRLDVMSTNVGAPDLASRPFDADRDGFVMGEGAGFVVLTTPAHARGAGWEILGVVAGYGSNADAHHLVAPSPGGEGALRCMRLALADAGAGPADVAHVNAHGTSTVLNDRAEAEALVALFGSDGPPVTARERDDRAPGGGLRGGRGDRLGAVRAHRAGPPGVRATYLGPGHARRCSHGRGAPGRGGLRTEQLVRVRRCQRGAADRFRLTSQSGSAQRSASVSSLRVSAKRTGARGSFQ